MSSVDMVSERPSIFEKLHKYEGVVLVAIAFILACAGAWFMVKTFLIMGF